MATLINDPSFPGIAKAMNKEIVRRQLQSALFPREAEKGKDTILVVSCNIKNLRHKLGRRFVLSYQLELLNTQTGQRRNQLISASLCKFGQKPPVLELIGDRSVIRPSTALYLEELAMMIWIFPHDNKLQYLKQVVDNDFLKMHLARLLPALACNPGSKIADIKLDILQYLPERSCMMRCCLTVEDPQLSKPSYRLIYGKNYPDDSGSQVFAVMQELARQLPDAAQPLAYDTELRMLWQTHVPGVPLEWRNLQTAKVASLLKNMASCVAALQDCQINTTTRYGVKEIDEQLLDTLNAAQTHDTRFAEQISLWVRHLIERRETISWPETLLRPLHQDLHLCNFMANENRVCLIDFDTVCLGDPLADIGSLLANFYRCGLYKEQDIGHIDTLVQAFLRYYQETISWKIDPARLNWFIAAALVHEVIRRVLRQQHESGLPNLNTYLALSQRYAGQIFAEPACA